MIGQTTKQASDNNDWHIALRDAVLSFLVFFLTQLVMKGFPPSIETVYISGISGALIGVISYSHSIGAKINELRKFDKEVNE